VAENGVDAGKAAILKACKDSWDETFAPGLPKNSENCSGFVKSVAAKLCAVAPSTADANGLVGYLEKHWKKLDSGIDAARQAAVGKLVIAGLDGSKQKRKSSSGHVVVVVDGPLYHKKYPLCWCGSTGDAQSQGDKSVGEVWAVADRDHVEYFVWQTAPRRS
jgi:hypothetical protein